jgi:hypothetical protein
MPGNPILRLSNFRWDTNYFAGYFSYKTAFHQHLSGFASLAAQDSDKAGLVVLL